MDGPNIFSQSSVADCPSSGRKLVAAIMSGGSALVTGPVGAAELLGVLAHSLAATRTRVVRVRPPLDLPDFMEQVAPASAAAGDVRLVQGFNTLTTPDSACDRIVLLVEDAHLLPQATLRYIEFALRAGPHLQVAFAGRSEIVDVLALDGFAGLRRQLSLHLTLPERLPAPAPAFATVPTAAPTLDKRQAWRLVVLGGVTFAVGFGLVAWLGHSTQEQPSMAAAKAQVTPATSDTPLPPTLTTPDLDPIPEPGPLPAPAEPQPTVVTQDVGVDPQPGLPTATIIEPPAEPGPLAASLVPEPAREAQPAFVVAVPAPLSPRQPKAQPEPPSSRSERVAARPPLPRQDERRCRGIIQRVQLGENPSDADRTFLRNGCR